MHIVRKGILLGQAQTEKRSERNTHPTTQQRNTTKSVEKRRTVSSSQEN